MGFPFLRKQLRKYFIMGSQDCGQFDPVEVLESALAAGITAFQFREKGEGSLTSTDKLKLGTKLRDLCTHYQVPFIVNDDIELVALLDADGIHVGQNDLSVERVRELFPDKVIGLSVSNPDEEAQSPIHLVDYLGAGPVFPTQSKADAKDAVGVAWIQTLRSRYPKFPIVGIGGITTQNAASVIEAGADGVSVISAITKADNIEEAVQKL